MSTVDKQFFNQFVEQRNRPFRDLRNERAFRKFRKEAQQIGSIGNELSTNDIWLTEKLGSIELSV